MRSPKALRSGLAAVSLLAIAGCGGSPTATKVPANPGTTPAAAASSSVATAAPAQSVAPEVPTVVAPAAAMEAALTRTWEATGAPSGAGSCMTSPAIDAAGRPWVAACTSSTYWVFESDGTFVEAWGEAGSEPGQFDMSYSGGEDFIGAIAFAPDGSFFTMDVGNLRIQHFDAQRKPLASWGSFGNEPGQFSKPTDIVVGPNGNVYVADGARGDIQVFSPDGTFVRAMGDGTVGQPDHFAWLGVDGDGNVFAASANRYVLKFAADGQLVLRIDCQALDGEITDSAGGPDGHLFATFTSDAEERQRGFAEFDADGKLLHLWPGIGEEVWVVDDGAAVLVTDYVRSPLAKYALPKD